jgi:hypothetical protein
MPVNSDQEELFLPGSKHDPPRPSMSLGVVNGIESYTVARKKLEHRAYTFGFIV